MVTHGKQEFPASRAESFSMAQIDLSVADPQRSYMTVKFLGWGCLAFLLGFLINNFLNIYFDFPPALSILSSKSGSFFAPAVVYTVTIVLFLYWFVLKSKDSLREQSRKVHMFNCFLIRWFFVSILLVGVADVIIAFLRVEKLLPLLVSAELVSAFNKPLFVGSYIHVPLIAISFLISFFSKTLGFTWLALMIVLAELLIVITRFVFSYEQPFMADLVRYWYAGLFLFASAYTLYDEGHVRVDIVYAGLKHKTQGFLNAIGCWLLGISTGFTIVLIAFNGKYSIINKPLLSFEVSQTGTVGMFIKYQLAVFLGIFGITMIVQFVSYFFESVADSREEGERRLAGQATLS